MSETQNEVADEVVPPQEPKMALVEYGPVQKALAELKQKLKGRAYDLTKVKDNDEARSDRKKLVTLRTSVEKLRLERNKETRAAVEAICKQRDEFANQLTAEIRALETPIDEQIKADEKRREEERAEKARAELARVTEIRERIALMANIPVRSVGKDVETITSRISMLDGMELTKESFQEYFDEAQLVLANAKLSMRDLLQAAQVQAAQAAEAQAAAERAARLEAEMAEQRRQDEARQAREAAERAAREEAEREAAEVLARAESQRQAQQQAADRAISEMQQIVASSVGQPSDQINLALRRVERMPTDHVGHQDRVYAAWKQALASLTTLHKQAQEAEAMRAKEAEELRVKQEAERAERERLAAEKADQERQEAAQREIEAEAARRAQEAAAKRLQALQSNAELLLETLKSARAYINNVGAPGAVLLVVRIDDVIRSVEG